MDDQVKAVLSQVLEVPVEVLVDSASQQTIANWDSMRHLSLVLALEQTFGVTFDDDQIPAMKTVGDVIATLKSVL